MDVLMRDAGFKVFRDSLQSPALRAIADHWLEAKGDKLMPSWSDLSPSKLAPHLTKFYAFNYDRETDEFYARLAGNRIMVGFGQSFRGTPMKDLHKPDVYQRCLYNSKRIIEEPAAYRGAGKLFKAGDQIVSGERIALPIGADGYHGDGNVGAADFDYKVLGVAQIDLIHDIEEWYPL